jgi:hypothetical protein
MKGYAQLIDGQFTKGQILRCIQAVLDDENTSNLRITARKEQLIRNEGTYKPIFLMILVNSR